MASERFDAISRAIAQRGTRRGVLGSALAALLMPVGATDVGAGTAGIITQPRPKPRPKPRDKPEKQTCGPCEVRRGKRRCKRALDNTACKGNGRCRSGVCYPRPNCLPALSGCSSHVEETNCCSGYCLSVAEQCVLSAPGRPCFTNEDCNGDIGSGRCVGYRCQA